MPSKVIDYRLAKADELADSAVNRFEHAAKRADVSAESLTLNNSMSVAPVGLG